MCPHAEESYQVRLSRRSEEREIHTQQTIASIFLCSSLHKQNNAHQTNNNFPLSSVNSSQKIAHPEDCHTIWRLAHDYRLLSKDLSNLLVRWRPTPYRDVRRESPRVRYLQVKRRSSP